MEAQSGTLNSSSGRVADAGTSITRATAGSTSRKGAVDLVQRGGGPHSPHQSPRSSHMCVGKVMSHAIPLCGRYLGWSTVWFVHSSDDGDAAVVSQLLNFVETCARVERQWRDVWVGHQVGEAVNTVAPQHQRE